MRHSRFFDGAKTYYESQAMIVADVHNHTNASHGKASVGEMYAAAKDRGLAVYGFSEHSPRPEAYSYPVEYREHLRQNFVRYASEVMQLRALSGSPKVLLGMELDWFPSERPFMEAAVAAYPFDYIIGGIHFLGSWGFDFTQDDWKISPQQCYTRYENYFRTLADMARSGLVDIAAHPDIIKLYSVDVFHQWLAMPESLALISEALTAIRDNGLVMEISSAGLRKPCNEDLSSPGDHEAGFGSGCEDQLWVRCALSEHARLRIRSAGSLCPFLRLHVQRHF